MKRQRDGFTIVEMLMIVVILGILMLVAVPNLLRARMMANDSNAKSTLRTLAEAAKMYKTSSTGTYPLNVTSLMSPSRSFLKENYCGTTDNGYVFTCAFGVDSYTFQASPINAGYSGTTTFTMTTGGVLSP